MRLRSTGQSAYLSGAGFNARASSMDWDSVLRSRPPGRRRDDLGGLLLGLGNSDNRQGRAALQSDVLPRWFDFGRAASSSRFGCRGIGLRQRVNKIFEGDAGRRRLHGIAATARIVLRLSQARRSGAHTLSRGLFAPGVGRRRSLALIIQAALGIDFDPAARAIRFHNPRLPPPLTKLSCANFD